MGSCVSVENDEPVVCTTSEYEVNYPVFKSNPYKESETRRQPWETSTAYHIPPFQTVSPAGTGVFINDMEVSHADIGHLVTICGASIAPGRYWFDTVSGAWGRVNDPYGTIGFLSVPNVAQLVRRPMKPSCSNGRTNIFINGREITEMEVARLNASGIYPSQGTRYWLLEYGQYGVEGSTTMLGSLRAMGTQSSGDNFWSTSLDVAGNSSGDAGYISFDDGTSVSWG